MTLSAVKTFRRGSSTWSLDVKAKTGHSSLIFGREMGPGAIYPLTKILTAFYDALREDPSLTFNPGNVLGGTTIERASNFQGTVMGKDNVIAATAQAFGDLRFTSADHLLRARQKMQKIVDVSTKNINADYAGPGQVAARIGFSERYPAMEETPGSLALLKVFSDASEATGLGPLTVWKENSGAADISFVAPFVKGSLDGLGPLGRGFHSSTEVIEIESIRQAAKRVAVFFIRLQGARAQ